MLKTEYNTTMPRGVYKRDPNKKYGMAANPNKAATIQRIVATRKANDSYKGKSGAEHHLWKGGRCIEKNGYVIIYKPEHPAKIHGKYVYEHRYVMEQELGRSLESQEDIHHIDGNRQNNSIDNLILFKNRSEHLKYHWRLEKEQNNNHGRWHRAQSH